MENMYRTRRFDNLWSEAIFICPQGLKTPGTLTDKEGKLPGWLTSTDDSNRDLQFFDAMLKTLIKKYNIDQKRIYVTGHSNGGEFTYLLWAKHIPGATNIPYRQIKPSSIFLRSIPYSK